ncbi:MAG: EAL domain-containing protein [Acidobacteria bacterium]|nr:EAL domain-containing protein [Acidobacteriota bacterium]
MMSPSTVRVLLVEDRPGEAELVRDMLSESPQQRFVVAHRDRLGLALAELSANEYDLVLLDLSLPDSRGLETFVRAHTHRPSVPIIVLTNHKDEEMGARAVRDGAQDYLVKQDTDSGLLLRSIRYALERQAAEEALRESEERYALAVRGANDGLWDWDLIRSSLYLSPRWKEMLGLAGTELSDDPGEWFARIHPAERSQVSRAIEAHLNGETPHFEQEYRIRHDEGHYLWVLARGVAVRNGDGTAMRMAGSQTDITARKRAEAQLLHDAFHDVLTGLANRALFVDRLQVALASAARKRNGDFAVLFLDLDRFKNVNDSLGHAAGDQLLTAIARRLEGFLRPGDTLARLGGDEFAILVNEVAEVADAVHVAQRIQELLGQRFLIDGSEVYVSASVGIALSSTGYRSAEEILRDADISMYRAKAAGRNRYEIFDREMHKSAVALLKLEMDLRKAVQEGSFVMHYQPIVALGRGRMVGFEGLVRWHHPERGLITPQQFISVAEETGLIVPIGWWVLAESCRQIAEWQSRYPLDPPLSISVNVSGKLFMQKNLVKRVVEILEHNHLDPVSLRLEITENILMDHGEPALIKLAELRALGVQLHIDDFGTGYSSLSYLQRFHYDTLKIDRTFIAEMDSSGGADVIIETIISLANLLGMNVIAEGIETANQVDRLRKMQCPQGQGFWFSRPLAPADAEKLIADSPNWK